MILILIFLSTLCCASALKNFNLDQLTREQLEFQPIYLQLPSGRTFLFWDLPLLRRLLNLQQWNQIEFRQSFNNLIIWIMRFKNIIHLLILQIQLHKWWQINCQPFGQIWPAPLPNWNNAQWILLWSRKFVARQSSGVNNFKNKLKISQYSLMLENGTEIGQQSVVFKKAHHKGEGEFFK